MRHLTGLYVHVPFCRKKCFFCSFAICIAKPVHHDEYVESLKKEAGQYQKSTVATVYIGGGTPTLLDDVHLQRLHQDVISHFKISSHAEYTIETNPDTIDLAKARSLRALGVNRVSLGAQSFDSRYLKFLGRTHQPADIYKCFEVLRKAGFVNINLDMMFGFPGQTLSQLKADLRKVVELNSEHLSFYNLSVEPNSLFHRQKVLLPDNDRMALYYQTVIDQLEKKGFRQYEISNFAKPGKASRHNQLYWECEDYIGLGMGAHSHRRGKRSWNTASLFDYLKRMKNNGKPIEGSELLGKRERFSEALLFGLRMNRGIDLVSLARRFNVDLKMAQVQQIERFITHGFFVRNRNVLRATPKGRLVLDELSAYLI